MLVNAIEGVVENGKICLREDIKLPEKTRVYVIVAELSNNLSPKIRSPRLANPDQLRDFHKQVVEVSRDAQV